MGMFDELRCHYPLPVAGANDLLFQTKSTPAQYMDQYEIRADGTLWHEEYETEDHSDPNAEPGSLESIMGCMARVRERWAPEPMTGEVRFYGSFTRDWSDGGIEFSAYFVNGALTHLETIKAPPAPQECDTLAMQKPANDNELERE